MKILERVASNDGATKFLLELGDGMRIESVFLVMDHDGKDSLCISSQVGCALACTFCSTGLIGYKRNLSEDEIVDQVSTVFSAMDFAATRRFDLSYMGMGEPLHNLDAVIASKDALRSRYPSFRFYVSTVGVAPRIVELAERSPDFGLQISLHAPTDDLRKTIMPINKAHNIAELLAAAENYAAVSELPVTLNYCLMANVNDQQEHAEALARLVAGRPFRIQLVNFNPHISFGYQPTSQTQIDLFLTTLTAAGIKSHHGRQLGKQEGAGCGQLDADYEAGALSRHKRTLPIQPR